MGLFDNAKAISAVKRLKKGKVESLSLAQITNLIINLPDARYYLSTDEFDKVFALFKEFKKCTTKIQMDLNGYYETCVKIIKKFDAIAPYEKYSGGNELEFSFLMEDLRAGAYDNLSKNKSNDENKRNESIEDKLIRIANANKDKFNVEEFVKYTIEESSKVLLEKLPYKKVKAFCGVVIAKDLYGKDVAIDYFYQFADSIIEEKNKDNILYNNSLLSYLSGLLCSCEIVSEEDSDIISIILGLKGIEKAVPISQFDVTVKKLKQIADVDTKYKVEEYINFLIPKVKELYSIDVTYDWLKVLMGLVVLSEHQGKEAALTDLDIIANGIISTTTKENCESNRQLVWVLCKLMYENEAITVEEMKSLHVKYNSLFQGIRET